MAIQHGGKLNSKYLLKTSVGCQIKTTTKMVNSFFDLPNLTSNQQLTLSFYMISYIVCVYEPFK